jgi:hypothetical protein
MIWNKDKKRTLYSQRERKEGKNKMIEPLLGGGKGLWELPNVVTIIYQVNEFMLPHELCGWG